MNFFENTRKPQGFGGKLMTKMMNIGHAKLSQWGFSNISVNPDAAVLDVGCGGGANIVTCGTINLDYRSLYHHFENGCFMADCQAVVEIKNDLIRTMGECRDVTDQYQTGRSAYLRLGQLFMRLFAGLL